MKALAFLKRNLFNIISWFVTVLLVGSIVGGGFWYYNKANAQAALVPEPTAQPDEPPPSVAPPVPGSEVGSDNNFGAITRNIQLKTNIP